MGERVYTHWTLPELRRISMRRVSGEAWSSIVEDYGVSESSIRDALSRNGLAYGSRMGKAERLAIVRDAVELRSRRCTWDEIATRLRWPVTVEALRAACSRYAVNNQAPLWRGRGSR
jgi:hypothetical protein